MKAVWKGTIVAESDATVVVEGNHYFPIDSVNMALLSESPTHTICPWKGDASYYNVTVDGEANRDAAWFYPDPKDAAKQITNYVAFWRGVNVSG